MRMPRVFIGSSMEGANVARAIEQNLERDGEVVCWDRLFEPGKTVYDQLLNKSRTFEFAVLVFTPDDLIRMRGQEYSAARDNVIFELGLFLGRLGPDRTFVVRPEGSSSPGLRLPSDLLGVVYGTYNDRRSDGDLRSAVGPFSTAVVNAIRAYRKSQQETALRADSQLVTVVERQAEHEGSIAFYETFQSHLRRTKRSVVLVGSGFHCVDRHGVDLASRYLRVLTGCALRHKVVRLEMAEPGMQRWGQMLVDYLAPMNNVEILLPRKNVRQSNLLKDICLMDPGTDQALVEMMVPRFEISPTADLKVEVAGEGLFIRSQKIADSFNRLIYDLRSKRLVTPASIEQLRDYFSLGPGPAAADDETVHYFAYGSNMRSGQMRDRIRTSRRIGSAQIRGYRLCFNIPGTIYSDGVCNIVPDAQSRVCGALYRASKEEFFRRMDFYEGVGQSEYERVQVPVLLDTGEEVSAYTYLSKRDTPEGAPSRAYLNIILEGARENALPADYIQHLEAWTCEAT